MKNRKISGKIFIAFAIVIAAAIFLGVASLVMVGAVGNIADDYASQTIPSISNLWIARRAILQCEESTLESTVVMTKAELDSLEDEIVAARKTLDDALVALGQSFPDFADEIAECNKRLQTVTTVRQSILAEAQKLTLEGNEAAYNIYHTEYVAAFDAAAEVMLDMNAQLNTTIGEEYAQAQSVRMISIITVIAVLVIAVAIAVAMTLILTKMLNTPIQEIEEAMKHVANGAFDKVSISYESQDELGQLAGSVRHTVDRLGIITESLTILCDEMGRGNFGTIPKNFEAFTGDYGKILGALRTVRDNLNNTLLQIDVSSDQVLAGSEQVADGAQALAQGATEQASSVEELLASMNELLIRVKANADHANNAKAMTMEADQCVTDSNRIMGDLMTAMNEINAASNQISKVIKSIDDIAFQTNILALNAAVEAARAGAAGKGFAVVADEVRSLAGKSAESVKTTTALIQNTLSAIAKGSQLATAASDSLNAVISKSAVVGQSVDEIALACNEQQDAVNQMTIGVEQISAVVQTTSATAEESAAASEELSGQANMLKDMLSKFNLITDLSISGEDPAPAPVVAPSYIPSAPSYTPAHSKPAAYDPGYPENEPESYYNQPYSFNSGDKY